ncbi:MAG: GspH/FimT family pseudopilin [Gammaproteobacteria bacterium]
MNTKKQNGFTIIELMVAIAVAMIVLGMGVPSFAALIRNNDAVAEINDLAAAISLARSEAVGRGVEVTVVPASGSDWTSGWLVGIDSDGDDTFPEAGEPVLRTYPAVSAIAFTAAPARLEYRPTGEVTALASFTMLPDVCDDNMNRQRTLSIAPAGYVDLTSQACP